MSDDEKFESQRKEFDAVQGLSTAYKNLCNTPIVDDDYPEVRHYYESAMRHLLRALKDNRDELYLKST